MKNARYIIILFLLIEAEYLCAQRMPQDALYLQYNIALNPAHTGIKNQWYAQMYYAKQWLYAGTPDFAAISVDGSISPKANFGFYATTEGMGLTRSVIAAFSYAYRLPLSEYSDLNFGLSAGGFYDYINISGLSPLVPYDPALNSFGSTMQPLINVGILYETSRLYAGIAVRNLSGARTIDNNTQFLLPAENRNSVLTIGSYFNIRKNLALMPYMIYQEDAVNPSIFDFMLALLYKYDYRLGFGFRAGLPLWKTNDPTSIPTYSMSLSGDMFYKGFTVGYTFTMGLNSFVVGYLGKHSITVGYYITQKLPYRHRIFHFKRHIEYCPTCYDGQRQYD